MDLDQMMSIFCFALDRLDPAAGGATFVLEGEDSQVAQLPAGTMPPEDLFCFKAAGGLATRVEWAPNATAAGEECWVVVLVSPGLPAVFVVGPYAGEWFEVPGPEVPWFALSSAAGIRAGLERGSPLVPKVAQNERLFEAASRSDPPPTDADGRL